MQRTVFYCAAFVISTCVASLVIPESSIYTFFMPSRITAELAILLTAVVALLFVLSGPLKELFASSLGLLGSCLMALAALGIITPTYFGEFYHYVPQSNLVTLLVLGVSYSLASLEIPHKNIIKQFMDIRGLIALRNLQAADTELKLWMVNHTPILFHS